ncbi:hypothetical protein [Hasllibacter sp. MH4015]|uniref:hypothetical protein n=1 Tax=Hasllibacter sp. MH4015 TaxID=2854029 RepID=UPI001CD1DCB6|nr:hypothetical protein [Hasllibacter sp. MH4015]
MRLTLLIVLTLILAACGRPLTEAEAAYMAELQGDTFDPRPVRIAENPLVGIFTQTYPTRPPVTCRERIVPPPETATISARTGGIVFFNTLHLREDLVLPDYTRFPDGTRGLVAAMFFAHEMTHIWQWQNRAITNYHPFRAFWEHATIEDPYLFSTDEPRAFLSYGFEQQASLVEEYVCCRAVHPEGGRTARLEALIGQVMPVTPLRERADSTPIFLPWEDAPLSGICS